MYILNSLEVVILPAVANFQLFLSSVNKDKLTVHEPTQRVYVIVDLGKLMSWLKDKLHIMKGVFASCGCWL